MAKNCMEITKLAFLGQNSGGRHGGDKPIFRVVGGSPPVPPLEEILHFVVPNNRQTIKLAVGAKSEWFNT